MCCLRVYLYTLMLDANIISLTKLPYSFGFTEIDIGHRFWQPLSYGKFDVHGCKHWHIHYELFILPFLTISSDNSKAKGDTNSCQDDFSEAK